MNQKLTVDFSYPTCLGSCHFKDFHNCLCDEQTLAKKLTHVIGKMIPEISSKTILELKNNRLYHTHPIVGEKSELVFGIIKEILKQRYDWDTRTIDRWIDNQCLMMMPIWQISCPDSKGIRLIGFVKDSVFNVLFIDYYHTIYPDEKNNEENIESYNFSAITYLKESR